jgi:hypothetical protein
MRQVISTMVAVLAIVSFTAFSSQATEVFHGQVLSAGSGRISIQEFTGRTATFEVPAEAKITRDGKLARLEDLKNTDSAKVTTDNRMMALTIEARSALAQAASPGVSVATVGTHLGTCISAGDGLITMLDQNGQTQKAFSVAADAKVTRDGYAATLVDLRSGDSLTVTTEIKLFAEVATAIEEQSQK